MRNLLFFLFVTTTLLACQSEKQKLSTDKPLIKLGAIIPISGPAANLGTVFEKGLELGMVKAFQAQNGLQTILTIFKNLNPHLEL